MRALRPALRACSFFVLVSALGCGGGSAGTVSGTVTLGGEPLKEGTVRFVPADGQGQTTTAAVKDGKFSAAVPAGEVRVEFSAPKVIGTRKMYDTPDSPVVNETAELVPARYNVQSTLKIVVKGGSQTETFALDAK